MSPGLLIPLSVYGSNFIPSSHQLLANRLIPFEFHPNACSTHLSRFLPHMPFLKENVTRSLLCLIFNNWFSQRSEGDKNLWPRPVASLGHTTKLVPSSFHHVKYTVPSYTPAFLSRNSFSSTQPDPVPSSVSSLLPIQAHASRTFWELCT